ncbi:MAG: PHP-associated domain-containing protein [Pseudomonadota bacterium]
MTPRAIVRSVLNKGLSMIGICDHNSSRNSQATIRAAQGSSVVVVPGLEITSSEEVHVLGLFPSMKEAQFVQEHVYGHLPGVNDEEAIGYQVVVDEFDMVDDFEQALLIGATTLNIQKVVDLIHDQDGIAVASHVDRAGFGIFSQLGFIPDGLQLDALEISKHTDCDSARKRFKQCSDYAMISSSDAHCLADIGTAFTEVEMIEASFDELRMAFKGIHGRRIVGPCKPM